MLALTTFPARDRHAWRTIETLLDQTRRADAIYLALSRDEYPDGSAPGWVGRYAPHGLEVLWTDGNPRSYKKLAPAREHRPEAAVVTVDDDALYGADLIEILEDAWTEDRRFVVGARGREIVVREQAVAPYVEWPLATPTTPSSRLMLTGVGGILYPPDLPSEPWLRDTVAAQAICPINDDVWFWAANRRAGVPLRCLGISTFRDTERLVGGPSLWAINSREGANDLAMRRAMDHFGLDI